MLPAGSGKGFVCTLNNPLCADVNPASCGHLPVHSQLQSFETIEFVTRRPVGNEIRIRDQYTGRMPESAEYANGLSGLHQQSFVIFEILKRLHDRMKCFPASSRASGSAVNDKLSRVFR